MTNEETLDGIYANLKAYQRLLEEFQRQGDQERVDKTKTLISETLNEINFIKSL